MSAVVADTGPLIVLARVGRLDLLRHVHQRIVIPSAVRDELAIGSGRSGATVLADALDAQWLTVQSATNQQVVGELARLLDPGEAEAIALAEQLDARFLLIDDAAGRRIARRRGIPLTGVAGVLLSAKARGELVAVEPIIKEMSNAGYHLSSRLVAEVLARSGERNR